MNPFKNQTPIHYMPPGYQVDLDRLPPTSQSGCGRIVALSLVGIITLALMCAGVGVLVSTATARPQTPTPALIPLNTGATVLPTESPQAPSPTLDEWSATGTALFFVGVGVTPTTDYCWYLTPSPEPTVTPMPFTPDAWALQGTQIALSTGTATFTPIPTQAPPKAWCDMQTEVFTPFPLPTIDPLAITPSATATIAATRTPAPDATATYFPAIQEALPPAQSQYVPQQPPAAAPVIIIQTSAPIFVTVVKVVTAVPSSTATNTATSTATNTATATEPPTATNTATATETLIPTETPTATPTATDAETATLFPTLEVIE